MGRGFDSHGRLHFFSVENAQELIPAENISQSDDTPPPPPPLKWAGGKRWLVPLLRDLYNAHKFRRLVEPFMGGLAVALGLSPDKAVLNDTNPHLVNFYQQLQKGLSISIEMRNDEGLFYQHRSRFNSIIESGNFHTAEAASLFYYLNRTCFNGLCRFNNSGQFNVPFGKYKSIPYVVNFEHYRSAFKPWIFTQGDFESLKIKPDDFLYVDPPYDVEFTKYAKDDFVWADQVRLVEWLASAPCPVVASNQATPRILDLYTKAGFIVRKIEAPRRISCTGDREPALEMLATKNI